MQRRQRVLIYVQHLSGTGHFVRMFEIARELARDNDVHLVCGGRDVPRRESPWPIRRIELPKICRGVTGLTPVESGQDIMVVMRNRRDRLSAAVNEIQPEHLLIEHFPFSKWDLYDEISSLIAEARAANPAVRIHCSLRDISPATRFDPQDGLHENKIGRTLHDHFDSLLVHADPQVVRLEDHAPWASTLELPVEYTGYVSEKPDPHRENVFDAPTATSLSDPLAVVSVGGKDGTALLNCCVEAWGLVERDDAFRNGTMVLFCPLFGVDRSLQTLEATARGHRVRVEAFTEHYLQWLQRAAISISQAGYNTCVNLLETQTRAILVPNPAMSDQDARARRFDELGLAAAIDPRELNVDLLASMMRRQIHAPRPISAIDLRGAQRTAELLSWHDR